MFKVNNKDIFIVNFEYTLHLVLVFLLLTLNMQLPAGFGSNTTKNEFVLKDSTIVPSAKQHVILGITIAFNLSFYSHLKQLYKMVANKLNALTRVAPCLSHNQRRLIYSSFLLDNEATVYKKNFNCYLTAPRLTLAIIEGTISLISLNQC